MTPAIMQSGIRALLAHVGLLAESVPPQGSSRMTTVGGDDHYVCATEDGLFEPLADIGQPVRAGQPAARIHRHDTPWREPELLQFQRDALVLCKSLPAPCTRGDRLFRLATDVALAGWAVAGA